MIRFLVYLAIAVGLAYCAVTVPLGKRTFVGHVRAIWRTDEVQELKRGMRDKAGPAVDRLERGVRAGYKAATEGSDAGARGPGSQAAPRSPAEAPP